MQNSEMFGRDAWTERAEWMRNEGVKSASWHADGSLASAELGYKPSGSEDTQPETPEAIEKVRRDRDKRLALLASSSLRPRIDGK